MTAWTAIAETGLAGLLFENPWPGVIACVGVSAVLRVTGKRTGNGKLLGVSWAALIAGLGLYAAAALIETDREALIAGTERFVVAVGGADAPALDALLDPRAALVGPGGTYWDQLTGPFIADEVTDHAVTDVAARAIDAVSNRPGFGASTMDVRCRVNGVPTPSTWELRWAKDEAGDWRIVEARWLTLGVQGGTPSPNLYR
ncbi:MAG: hypothetical protein AAFX76_01080 [Planctomycetota bacterium]